MTTGRQTKLKKISKRGINRKMFCSVLFPLTPTNQAADFPPLNSFCWVFFMIVLNLTVVAI